MTAPIEEAKTEYVTQEALDRMFQSLADRFQESDDANRQRFDAFRQDVVSLIQQSAANNLAKLQQFVDERLAKEKAERESDIDSLAGELRAFAKDINNQVGEMQKGVSKITGLMESLPETLKARDEKDAEIRKAIHARIDTQAELLKQQDTSVMRVQSNVDTLEQNQGSMTAEMKRIRATIHGDPENKDDAPSLFRMMGELKEQMSVGFTGVGSRLDITTEQLGQARADIATINKERAEEKARWAQHWTNARAFGKELLKSRWVQLAIGALLAGVAMSVFPELRPQLVQTLLDQLKGGG